MYQQFIKPAMAYLSRKPQDEPVVDGAQRPAAPDPLAAAQAARTASLARSRELMARRMR